MDFVPPKNISLGGPANCYKIVDSQTLFTLCRRAGVGNFGNVGVGFGHFTSDSATLLRTANYKAVYPYLS